MPNTGLQVDSRFGSLLSFTSWSRLTGSSDDDWIDKLNHLWSVVLLGLFALVVSSGQYVGDPIHCWCPKEFSSAYVEYTKSICWISNTYYIPMDDVIPRDIRSREREELVYYQWVPLILLFQAFLFKIPNLAWQLWHTHSGIALPKVSTLAGATMLSSPEERVQKISHIALYMNRWIKSHREYHRNFKTRLRQKVANVFLFCIGRRDGTFLVGFYLFVKFLYCVNVVGQFFLLNAFLATDYNMFGFQVIDLIMRNGDFEESPRFPRVTLCDFEIRQLQNVQRWTIQCVLPINLFNEKIFIFIWFWLFFVACLTFLNYFSWLYYTLFRENRGRYVRKYLKILGELNTEFDRKVCRKFADQYLRNDGIFVLKIVGKNSTEMVVTDLVLKLWKDFKEEYCSTEGPSRNNSSTELMNGDLTLNTD